MNSISVLSFDKKTRFTRIIAYTVIFMILAHAYRYFNNSFSHDSTTINSMVGNSGQISIGRFLQPVYLLLRGGLNAPFLIGLMSTLWLAISLILLIDLLNFKRELTIVLVCGLLSTSSTLTLSNATYIPWSDIVMLSLLLSIAGVYFAVKLKTGFLYAPILISASLALYQAYFQVAVMLLMLNIIFHILDGNTFKSTVQKILQHLCVLFAALVLYYVVYKIVLSVTGITAAEAYNSPTSLGGYSKRLIVTLFLNTYRNVANYFLYPETFGITAVKTTNIIIFIFTFLGILRLLRVRSINLLNRMILLLVLLLLPFGADVVFFLAKFEHSLMTFSFILFYVFALKIAEYYQNEFVERLFIYKISVQRFFIGLFGAIIIFNNVVFANQVYFMKKLEYQTTTMIVNRVINHIEGLDSYAIGDTPVAIIGSLRRSPLAGRRSGFEHLRGVGLEDHLSLTYYETYRKYFEQILYYPINLVPQSVALELQKTSEVQQMPIFPNDGYCKYIDNILVIKFSNQ